MPLAMAEVSSTITSHFWRRDAELAERTGFESGRQWGDGSGVERLEPVGVVGAIAPWNGAIAAVTMKVSPALAAGCTVVAKPAWEAPTSSLILAEGIEADKTYRVNVRVFGDTLGGDSLESSTLVFPITTCDRCLISFPVSAWDPLTSPGAYVCNDTTTPSCSSS